MNSYKEGLQYLFLRYLSVLKLRLFSLDIKHSIFIFNYLMLQRTFLLILKSKSYTIPTIFPHILDMSPEVYNKIIFDQNHSYRVESNVSQQVFQSFVNYMINDEKPDVTIETFNQ